MPREEMTLVNIDLIVDSPWQSRSTMDMIKLAELELDIYTSRLHQPVVLRPVKGSYTDPDDPDSWTSVVYETSSGHRRVAAFRQLHNRGWEMADKAHLPGPGVQEYWAGDRTLIPAIIYDMTDAEAARTVLAENRMREDVNVMDEIRAVRRALDGTNVSAHDLAVSLGISDQQISNRLRLLRLPEGLQDCVGAGKLSWTTARELLAFVGTDCDHSKELAFVERRVQDYDRAMPISTLKQYMAHARKAQKGKWRRLTGRFENWMSDDDEPLFDVAEFKRSHSTHTLPMDSHMNSGNRVFTCAVDEFDRLQAEGKRAIAEIEAAEREDETEAQGAESRDSGRQPPTQEEIDDFELECNETWDAWDEAIKAAYARVGPVVRAMDDGHIAKAVMRHPSHTVLRTWGEPIDYTSDFCWRQGWHVKELMYLLDMSYGTPKNHYDWQLADAADTMKEAALSLGLIDKREYIRLLIAAELAICEGDCSQEETRMRSSGFCTRCSAAPVEEEDEPAELQEAS